MFVVVTVPVVYAITITVDGYNTGGEWANVPPMIWQEANEPQITDNVDMRNIYATCDTNNAYFRIDTWSMPPRHTSTNGLGNQIYLDVDQNNATGCDDTVAHSGQGYEAYIYHVYFITGWFTYVYQCDGAGSWNLVGDVGNYGYGNLLEISASLSDLTIASCPADATVLDNVDMFFYYDGADTNPDDEVPESGSVTLIELAFFGATAQGGGVQVAWETVSEVDNAGFNIYRSEDPGTGFEKLNAALVPAQGGPTQGASYTYNDVDVVPGSIYFYKLEDVDTFGQATLHGPIIVEVGEMPTSVDVLGFAASGASALAPALGLALGAGGLAWTWRRKRR
jgi:hypothetical protein